MCNVVSVTAKPLCKDDFLQKIQKISDSDTQYIILREKYLSEQEYYSLAKEVLSVCDKEKLIIHNFIGTAESLGIKKIHLPFSAFKELNGRRNFDIVGTSVHSVDDAAFAQENGADYITAGNIYETDCKKGLKGKGVNFLRNVCDSVNIPVYAIGGINDDTAKELKSVNRKNFAGVCVMSLLMQSENINDEVMKIKRELG
ncbi:thiamine phosphate synthase [uncultured Ruminococcus sp.]|uniref:thiamine phosphate synthase n=1 Tax=uncultured Ruminococcus sp. TaxID=165186 RepID=UPI0025CE3094|nr:thiamine phosphate synthase [uncultured Ruminococcus sp.]